MCEILWEYNFNRVLLDLFSKDFRLDFRIDRWFMVHQAVPILVRKIWKFRQLRKNYALDLDKVFKLLCLRFLLFLFLYPFGYIFISSWFQQFIPFIEIYIH
jgi:hypothetical protein